MRLQNFEGEGGGGGKQDVLWVMRKWWIPTPPDIPWFQASRWLTTKFKMAAKEITFNTHQYIK